MPPLTEASPAVSTEKTPPLFLKKCCVCAGSRLHYLFSIDGNRVVRCDDCGLLMLNPQPPRAQLRALYLENKRHEDALKRQSAKYYLSLLQKYRGTQGGKLLEVECGGGDFLLSAQEAGYDVTGLDPSPVACEEARQKLADRGRVLPGELHTLREEAGLYDVCVLFDVLEHANDPRAFLASVHTLLKPGGVLLIAAPGLNSPSVLRKTPRWKAFRPGRLFYFGDTTLQSLLFHSVFHHVIRQPGRANSAEGTTFLARAKVPASRSTLSVIVPAYNEAVTVRQVIDQLLAKRIENLDTEIVIVESNSTDGTRTLVSDYADRSNVKLVFEDKPRGKGHAIRTGLTHATGDFILIQDADLEYDFEDYDVLMEPLITGRTAFVLGSRHGGRILKMRKFQGDALATFALNAGHWLFCAMVDLVYWMPLRDPFTMFKVFRRDCLYGLRFECNRFDFDFELLIKLVRKGFMPIEIPVNYTSRSFDQGKKVSVWRDPWTWLRAIIKFRFVRIDPLQEISTEIRR